ncbi:MAG TPA: nitroreductase [Pusillimonas sp.]|uniref:nitroreductase family protein n=1 Tax=Pusillimonas sp. TaxID=3040095 RepID=UPI002B91CECB|nr:nitroreductase [Pusillimonas sp.]HUH87207.1 nitroreductase [Pusillimonas sp.]
MSVAPIDYLFSRRSVKFVQAPGPNEDQLGQILRAAMSAPDHGQLRPWRFKLIRGEAVVQLGELALGAIKRAGLPLTTQKEASTREWLKKVPLLIALACRMDTQNTKIPEDERMLATGAAVTNMLNAAHMLGFGAYWSTGLGTYVEEVTEALGFDPLEYRFMGYLAVGTPIALSDPPQRPDYREFVTEWTGR